MTKVTPAGKSLLNQRDKEIFEYIIIMLDKGYSASQIYEKLHRLTGLEPLTIRQIRFDQQRRLVEAK
jgi:hypothetical protein